MTNPPPPYDNITGISRAVMKDNAQETIQNSETAITTPVKNKATHEVKIKKSKQMTFIFFIHITYRVRLAGVYSVTRISQV